jgi:flagellar hook-associated protein 1 FlgK
MLGLFGTLNLGTRSLQTQQSGVEVTGQNLANVNNPAYARQRLQIQTSLAIPSSLGPVGTGASATGIDQLRNSLLDAQIRNEQSVGGYWLAQQSGLQNVQVSLSEYLDRGASTVDGTTSGGSIGSLGISDALDGLFSAFQSVATSPSSLTDKQALVSQAQTLATRFNNVSQGLTTIRDVLNESLTNDVRSANQLLADVASLNDQIAKAEMTMGGKANDLRDLREQKLEKLATLVDFETATGADGTLSISIGGVQFVSGIEVTDRLATFGRTGEFSGTNEIVIASAATQTALSINGGSMAGTIDARDGTLQKLRDDLDTLAATLISEVNALHSTGATNANFFEGTGAVDIRVNPDLAGDPSLFQSGVAGLAGDNSIALALANLANQPLAGLGNLTPSDFFGKVTGDFGHALAHANTQVANYNTVNSALLKQRDSISGVSIDEEMTNLLTYQKAYQASAKIITTVDEMLDTILNMKR